MRILKALTLAALVLAPMTAAAAEPARRGEPRGEHRDYHREHGKKFEHGYYYHGREHRHWTSCYFDDRFGCYLYHCPATEAYYYWCERDTCYYPTTHCPYNTYACK